MDIYTDKHFCSLIMNMLNDLPNNNDYQEGFSALEKEILRASDDEVILKCSPFELAERLHDTDGAKPMNKNIATYCLEIYFDEYLKGNADAALNLGSLYYTGRAVEQDFAKAVEYYTFAADNGNRQAGENLGYCYYYGRSVEIDYEKAYHYFVKGALDGHLISLYKIGDMYKNGYYVKKDEKESFAIYSHCLDLLDDESIPVCGADIYMRMANCLYKGIGTTPNYEAAFSFYGMAESMYYKRLQNGDYMIKGNLERVIKEENELRKEMMSRLDVKNI